MIFLYDRGLHSTVTTSAIAVLFPAPQIAGEDTRAIDDNVPILQSSVVEAQNEKAF